jgi:pyridinium-3,5-biscarboxylic acid mononucleotide sulfurtransferase
MGEMSQCHNADRPDGTGPRPWRAASAEAGLAHLKATLEAIGPAVVAFSGGIDSTLLLKVGYDTLGDRILAVTAVSPSLPDAERDATASLARAIGVAHRFVATDEMDDPGYVANDGRRCYHCKRALFRALRDIAPLAEGRALLYGAIPEDFSEDRPGLVAAAEAHVRAPLAEAGLTKPLVRELARRLGLPNWDKPAMACLASRIPVHTPVTVEALARVDRAEAALRSLGYRQVRVRHHGSRARIEIGAEELAEALTPAGQAGIDTAVRNAGYEQVDVDPRGYRPGGHAEPIPPGPRPDRALRGREDEAG